MSARKAAKPAREAAVYAVGDIVLGKVRGYAPWPGMVVDPENVPQMVTEDRPKSTKTTFYCVRFFPNNDYAWLVEKDISRLKPHEIASFLGDPAKKKVDLVEAYKIAQDPKVWIEETDRKAKEALEAQSDEDDAEEDQLESDTASTSAKSKKRKRQSEGGVTSASAKKSKKGGAAEKESTSASAKTKKGNASAKGGKNGAKKSKAVVESEDEHGRSASGAEDAGPSGRKEGKEPPAKKARRDQDGDGDDDGANANEASSPENQRVKDWRHKLQKTFLGKVPPRDEDMPEVDTLFTTVETTEVGIEGLQYSKIGKVMRHIAALAATKVPRDAEFKFRERAKLLVERWQGVLNAAKGPTNGTPTAGSPGKEEVKAAKDTAAAINNAAAADADMDAHGEADAPGEVEGEGEAEVKGVEEGTAKIDLNGTKPADVEMAEA